MLDKNELGFLSENLSSWGNLTDEQKREVESCAFVASYEKGKKLYGEKKECLGLVLIKSGQLRSFITSKDGKEIGLYRLLSLDVCILTASCMIRNINFDINVEVEKEAVVFVIPTVCFNKLSEGNAYVKNFTLELVSARFSEVMWVFDQYVFGTAAGRLASFLLNQANLEGTDMLKITHEYIANDLGTAREVITRLLKHFSSEGLVELGRGSVTVLNKAKLAEICS